MVNVDWNTQFHSTPMDIWLKSNLARICVWWLLFLLLLLTENIYTIEEYKIPHEN